MIELRKIPNLTETADWWFQQVDEFFTPRRLSGLRKLWIKTINQATGNQCERRAFKRLGRLIWKYRRNIILASPQRLKLIVSSLERHQRYHALLKEMAGSASSYFNKIVTKKDTNTSIGRKLVEKLNLTTCPYCNRNFIHAYKGGNRPIRPELDHFYPKSEYPLLALSFYNLIPVCHFCNHLKSTHTLGHNPYEGPFKGRFKIIDEDGNHVLLGPKHPQKLNISIKGATPDEQTNIDILGLQNVYQHHTDYVAEIIDKAFAYDSHARQALADCFQKADNLPADVHRFVWGPYLDAAYHDKRPLAKLTADILSLLNIKR